MTQSIHELMNKIITLKKNSDYRIGDVILHRGLRWKKTINDVLSKSIYEGTILREYLEKVGTNAPDLDLLFTICEQHKTKYIVPDETTLVIHIRAGDVCVHEWFFKKDYVTIIDRQISKSLNEIQKITFVICFSYCEYTEKGWWVYTENKQQLNIQKLTIILQKCIDAFPNISFDVYSNHNTDKDLIFCVFAKRFVCDEGGFSQIMNMLREKKRNGIHH